MCNRIAQCLKVKDILDSDATVKEIAEAIEKACNECPNPHCIETKSGRGFTITDT